MFKPIGINEAENVLANRSLGFSYLRLLPKSSSMRFIFNMGRKVSGRNCGRMEREINVNPLAIDPASENRAARHISAPARSRLRVQAESYGSVHQPAASGGIPRAEF